MPPDLTSLARTGPLIPAWGIALLALVFAGVLVVVSRPAVRARWGWLLLEALVVTALSALHLLFFWQPYRTSAQVPAGGGDMASFFYPIHAFAAREVQAGRFPFWDPHLFSGAPHLANFQTGTLYPPNLLAYLVARPYTYATLEMLAIGHFLLASYAAYWLARSLGASRTGGVLAGAIYAYSGFLVAHLGHYPMLATAAWAPLVLAAIVGTVRRDSWVIAILGVIPLTCAVLGGHQPILLMTLTMAVVVALFELWRVWSCEAMEEDRSSPPNPLSQPWEKGRKILLPVASCLLPRAAKLASMAIIALGLTVPALVPSLELTRYTVRGGLDYPTASQFSIEPIGLLHLVLPTVFGSNPTDYWGPFSNTEIWGYAGVLSLLLAAYALVIRPTRTRVFWLVVAIAAVLYAVGPFAALHGWAYAFLPEYDKIRGAGRAMMFFDLAVALLAGFGLDALLRSRRTWSPRQWAATKWGTIGLGVTLAVVVLFVIPLFAVQVLGINDPTNRPMIALDNVNLLAIWLALGLGVAIVVWRSAIGPGMLTIAVFAVVLLDLFHATAPFNPTTAPILIGFEHRQAVQFLREREQADGPFRIESATPAWQPDLALLAGLDNIGGLFDPLAIKAYSDYRNAALADRSSDTYRSLNARYVVTNSEAGPPGAGYTQALKTDDALVIWEAPDWRPRAWIDGSDAPVQVRERPGSRVDVTIPAGAGGRLIVSQVDYPGWTATVDGQRVDIGTWNGVLQQIDLPPDAHTVTLTFQPNHWTLWLATGILSGIVWLATLGLVLRQWLHQRRNRATLSSLHQQREQASV
jgi:hypothetical protein